MYVVGLCFNADGDLVPVGADSFNAGFSKNLYADNGSCGYIILDGFTDMELLPFDITDSEELNKFRSTILAAAETYCDGYSIVLATKDADGSTKLVGFEDFEPETGDVFDIIKGSTGDKVKADFLYTEADSDDEDIDDYNIVLECWN